MEALSEKQQQIFDYIKSEIKIKGYVPTIREIGLKFNLTSTSTVHTHLVNLEKKGYIKRYPTKNRSIEILEKGFYDSDNIDIPILGTVSAGLPIFADENIEDILSLPIKFVRQNTAFILRIKGDSMKNAGILNNDLVIVNKQENAENGDIIIALMEDEATCKYFYKEKDHVKLVPANESFEPIIVNKLKIIGKVIGLYRQC